MYSEIENTIYYLTYVNNEVGKQMASVARGAIDCHQLT
nr:hypothetical protein [Vibrio alginolyticus]